MRNKKFSAFILALLLIGVFSPAALAGGENQTATALKDTAAYVYQATPAPQVGSIGGEWAVLGLARSGYAVPASYYETYYAAVEKQVQDCQGVLDKRKYTEYSRVILALTAIGKDPTNVAGYDLTMALGDYEKTIWQGINGPIWALIALDSGNYDIPINEAAKTQASRAMYVERIVSQQLTDGGFSLTGEGAADPDITGMALQALAKYKNTGEVQAAIDKALRCLSGLQHADGGYYWHASNSESVVQVIVALNELGISVTDSRFVKNGKTLTDNLLSFYSKGKGFRHTAEGDGNDGMATEQGLYGLVSLQRAIGHQNSLYRMNDVKDMVDPPGNPTTPGKPTTPGAIVIKPITASGKTFADIDGHANQKAIEALAARAIINGMSDTIFSPDATMIRAQFAAIMVGALNLPAQPVAVFGDISPSAWYASYVGTAYTQGIVKGISAASFNPAGTITREEAAAMVTRAAKLCGMDVAVHDMAIRDMLAQFGDYTKISDWARGSLAFCYRENI
ncbi:MAG: S-layer homology domain-containing protein, partial [Clostridiales bacterium]